MGLWLGAVVLYDLGLLAAVVADNGGWFTTSVFPFALLANPADAFRLFNLAASEATAAAAGVAGAANSIPLWQSAASVLLWPLLALALATAAKKTVASVHEIVELGALDPEHIVTPGIYVSHIVKIARVATQAGGFKKAA